MKRKNKTQNKFLPVILVVVGLVATAGIVFAMFKVFGLDKLFNKNTTINPDTTTINDSGNTTPTTKPQNSNNGSSNKEDQQNTNEGQNNFEEKQPVIHYSDNVPSDAGAISGVITYTGIVDDTLVIRVNIDQYIDGGTCVLALVGRNTNYSEAARIIDSAATSTCEGFNIPLNVLKEQELEIIIEVKGDDKQGVIRGNVSL